jgi:glycosyltransferase involved in cell wall biosynthesis
MTSQQKEKTLTVGQRVSVAMCTCDGARFLPEQLQSIASQTILPNELVVCDDVSTDNSVAIIEDFSRQAPFEVKLFRNGARLGPAKNFGKALRLCESEIIFLSDQDDIWKSTKVESLVGPLHRDPQAVYAFSNAEMINELGDPLGQTFWDEVGLSRSVNRFSGLGQLRLLLRENLIAGASMAFRASFREIVLPIPSGWMHDHWIVLLGSTWSHGIPVPERLFKYRRHTSQVNGLRKKSLGHVVRESISTGQDAYFKKIEQFREIQMRLDLARVSAQCPQDRLELLKQKEAHLLKRATLRSASGISRAIGVLAEASTGRYQLFSDSWLSIVRDLT